jgi:hypothetical protein
VNSEYELKDFFLQPSKDVIRQVQSFVFTKPTIGFHMRRTDKRTSSTDASFIRYADHVINCGGRVFLSTDNEATFEMMFERFGKSIVRAAKRVTIKERWPRTDYSAPATLDDWIDLLLLSKCEYVIGSEGSSYSRHAMIRNGDSRCRFA